MVDRAAGSSPDLWLRYTGAGQVVLTVALGAVTLALLVAVAALRRPYHPPVVSRRRRTALLVLWPVSIVAFLVAITIYAAQLEHDYPNFVAPQSPVLPVTLSAALASFVLLVLVRPSSRPARVAGAAMAALAAPMIFELPFDLLVMWRTTPPVVPDPWAWRLLFFTPLFVVELVTIALLLAVPGVRVTRWTFAALAAQFLTFTGWAAIGFGYPGHDSTFAANAVAKVCAFVVACTMALPERGTSGSPGAPGDDRGPMPVAG